MKKILSLILLMTAITFSSFAQDSKDTPSSVPIQLETHMPTGSGSSTRPRTPMYIDIEAWYDSEEQVINISYDGDADGEVLLYLNGNIVDVSSEINTTFRIQSSGLYQIEIITENWTAEGSIQL